MSKYIYTGKAYETKDELDAAVTAIKDTLDNKPTTWCVVKPMINPQTIETQDGDVIGYDSGDPLTDEEINALSDADKIYNVYSVNAGDNFTEVSEAAVIGKIRAMRKEYANWLRVHIYHDTVTDANMNVSSEDMTIYV
jgi:hypothetical protein